MEPDFPWMIWHVLSVPCICSPSQALRGAATNPPHSGLRRQPLSKRTLQLFLPSSLSPISVKNTGKHLESNSLRSPSLSHRRLYLPTGNVGRRLPMNASFAALQCAAFTEEAISCPAGRRRRALGISQPPACQQAAGRDG